MPAENPVAEVNRLLSITQEANKIFDAYARAVRAEILKARLARDLVSVAMLEAALKSARNDVDKMERQLGRALLSSELVDRIEGELTGKAKEANDLIQEMEAFGRTLERVRQGAEIAAAALRTVSGILA